MIPIQQAVDFVLANRKGKAFKKYNADQIRWAIQWAIKYGSFTFCANESGRLVGIVLGTANHRAKVLRVHEILAIDPRCLPAFVTEFKTRYPDYILSGKRRGKDIVYDTRLVEKLTKPIIAQRL